MKKVEFVEILNTLCEELGLTPNYSRPFGYNDFKNAMLSSDLIVTERVIRTRWEQLVAKDDFLASKGLNVKGETVIALNVNRVRIHILANGKKPWNIGGESERETHTEEESQ